MATLDLILARLERLEAENAALRRRLDEIDVPARETSLPLPVPLSRRAVLRRAGSGAAALGIGALAASVATLSQPAVALADGEAVTVGGTFTDATALTTLENRANNTSVLVGRSKGGGSGIVGESATGFGGYFVSGSKNGVYGQSGGGSSEAIGVRGAGLGGATGVRGESSSGFAVDGETKTGTGVRGQSSEGWGVVGQSTYATGVGGSSTKGNGVEASSDSGDGVHAASTTGAGVRAVSNGGPAVDARSSSGVGLNAISEINDAIVATSQLGSGVAGFSNRLSGVFGKSSAPAGVGVQGVAGDQAGLLGHPRTGKFGTGVVGSSGSGGNPPRGRSNTGVMGVGTNGRGGVFIGGKAQVQLVPSSAVAHPASGSAGDLFVDKSGRLWFCKGGATWILLA